MIKKILCILLICSMFLSRFVTSSNLLGETIPILVFSIFSIILNQATLLKTLYLLRWFLVFPIYAVITLLWTPSGVTAYYEVILIALAYLFMIGVVSCLQNISTILYVLNFYSLTALILIPLGLATQSVGLGGLDRYFLGIQSSSAAQLYFASFYFADILVLLPNSNFRTYAFFNTVKYLNWLPIIATSSSRTIVSIFLYLILPKLLLLKDSLKLAFKKLIFAKSFLFNILFFTLFLLSISLIINLVPPEAFGKSYKYYQSFESISINLFDYFLYQFNLVSDNPSLYINTSPFVRINLWGVAWHHFFDNSDLFHQIFGSGAASSYYITSTYLDASAYFHNLFFEILICYGIFGIIAYLLPLLMLFSFFVNSHSQALTKPLELKLSSFLIAFLSYGVLARTYRSSELIFPIAITISIGAYYGFSGGFTKVLYTSKSNSSR